MEATSDWVSSFHPPEWSPASASSVASAPHTLVAASPAAAACALHLPRAPAATSAPHVQHAPAAPNVPRAPYLPLAPDAAAAPNVPRAPHAAAAPTTAAPLRALTYDAPLGDLLQLSNARPGRPPLRRASNSDGSEVTARCRAKRSYASADSTRRVGEDVYNLRPLRQRSVCRRCGNLAFLREYGVVNKGRYCSYECFVIGSRPKSASGRRPGARRRPSTPAPTITPITTTIITASPSSASVYSPTADGVGDWRRTEWASRPLEVARAPPTSTHARARTPTTPTHARARTPSTHARARPNARTAHMSTQTDPTPPLLCSACAMLAADKDVVAKWSVEQTRQFVELASGADLARRLAQERVNGRVLLTLHCEHLQRWYSLPFGPVNNLIRAVRRLRAATHNPPPPPPPAHHNTPRATR